MIKIAINGFGRIGRLTLRKIQENPNMQVVAINDLTDPAMLAYLLKYDSVQGTSNVDVNHTENSILFGNNTIQVFKEPNPENLPWKSLEIDIVIESTGFFATKEKASAHLKAGAKKVLISAPAGKDVKTIVYNVNHDIINESDEILSSASCTTNCLAPMAQVLNNKFGIITGQMTTIHAFTNSQPLLDSPDRKLNFRGSRSAAGNIVPYKTGAAKAIGLVIPELEGKLDGSSQRVPVLTGSVVELFTILNKKVTVEEVNQAMKENTNESFGYTTDFLVSSDIIGMKYGSLFDSTQTKITSVGNTQLVKTVAWYDNEMSFVEQLARTVSYIGEIN